MKKPKFKWNVLCWDHNADILEYYDVVPTFYNYLKSLKPAKRPKTKEELSDVLHHEAMYRFWGKCEWEMILHSWPKRKNTYKLDVYEQLTLNWDLFIDKLWSSIN